MQEAELSIFASGGVPAELSIATEIAEGVAIMHLDGELDAVQCSRLREALIELVDQETMATCVDMKGLTFINSAGIATLIECLQGMRAYGGKLHLAALTEDVRNVFQVARLDTVFRLFTTEREAVDAFRKPNS
jgi:anti-sigma B factor antagonist